jgi:hypothetical protein
MVGQRAPIADPYSRNTQRRAIHHLNLLSKAVTPANDGIAYAPMAADIASHQEPVGHTNHQHHQKR